MRTNATARRIIALGPDRAVQLPELEDLVNQVSGGDDFWYRLSEGYLNPEDVLEDQDEIEELVRAVAMVREFEYIINQMSLDR